MPVPLNLTGVCPIRYSARNKWCPVTSMSVLALAPTAGFSLRLNSRDSGNDTEVDENSMYFIPDVALNGNGALPYPMAPVTEGADELLTINNFSLATSHDWHLKLAGMVPSGNGDRFAARGLFNSGTGQFESDRRWPLWTLWADDSNWIEFVANCERKAFQLRVCTGRSVSEYDFGVDTGQSLGRIAWTPESPLLAAMGYDHAADKLYVGASLGGDLVELFPEGISYNPSVTFTELRFRGAPNGGYSQQGEVCEFRWFGGLIDDSNALTNTGLPGAFTDLSFLT